MQFTILLLIAVAPLRARAQTGGTAAVQGFVRDTAGTLIPDALVAITRTDGAYVRRISTDRQGIFRFVQVPPGRYSLSAQRIGHFVAAVRDVNVAANTTHTVNIILRRRAITLAGVSVKVGSTTRAS